MAELPKELNKIILLGSRGTYKEGATDQRNADQLLYSQALKERDEARESNKELGDRIAVLVDAEENLLKSINTKHEIVKVLEVEIAHLKVLLPTKEQITSFAEHLEDLGCPECNAFIANLRALLGGNDG